MMSDYQLTSTTSIIRTSDGASIPADPANRDYESYLVWLAVPNTPDPYVAPPPPVPASITDRQFFQQLAVQGIITQADALAANAAVIPQALLTLINAMPPDQQFGAKMIVSGATTFFRDNALAVAIGTNYGMTPAQIDEFFTAAAAL
jgi:hypothetical protein